MAAFPAGAPRAALRLQAVREEDAGLYGCQALGEAGIAFDSTVLHVGCKSCCLLPRARDSSPALLSGSAPLCCFPRLPSREVLVLGTNGRKPGRNSKLWEDAGGSASGKRQGSCFCTET